MQKTREHIAYIYGVWTLMQSPHTINVNYPWCFLSHKDIGTLRFKIGEEKGSV